MTICFGYTRVSTVRQGEHGVSLTEQRAAIEEYAQRLGITISEWFEERLTAAKRGRPLFSAMLRRLRKSEAEGVVIHKIDRSARNLRDWAEMGELIDLGVSVHFAGDSVDLHSRGGRLSADIQAVVAADYVRNLREETLKGIRGRLKQGLYPFRAPLGYVDNGGGKLKTVDPVRGPLVQAAFDLYATGRYTQETLLSELHLRGLTNHKDQPIRHQTLSRILNNRFYTGLIVIETTGETYPGQHQPLIDMPLFRRVQDRLSRHIHSKGWVHDFTLRGLFVCSPCGRSLVGERQKGHVYYRCHTRGCATRGFREEILESSMLAVWPPLAVGDAERKNLFAQLEALIQTDRQTKDETMKTRRMQLAAINDRLARLVDALVDGVLDKASFNERNRQLLEEQAQLKAAIAQESGEDAAYRTKLTEVFELAISAQQSYLSADSAGRRELAQRLCSNRSVAGKDVVVEPHPVLRLIEQRRLLR